MHAPPPALVLFSTSVRKLRLAAACGALLTTIPAAGATFYDVFDVHFAWTPGVRNYVTVLNPGDRPLVIQRIERDNDRWSISGTCVAGTRLAPGEHCSIAARFDAPAPEAEGSVLVSVYTDLRPDAYRIPFHDGPMFSGALAPASLVKHLWASGLAARPVPAHDDAVEYVVDAIGKRPGCEARVRFIGFRPGLSSSLVQQQRMRFSLLSYVNEEARLGMFAPSTSCKELQEQVIGVFKSYKPNR